MKTTPFIAAVEKAITLKMIALDAIVETIADPLEDIGNPESLIGKPYDQWTPEDLTKLTVIYGQKSDSPLSKTIFNREYAKVQQLQTEVK